MEEALKFRRLGLTSLLLMTLISTEAATITQATEEPSSSVSTAPTTTEYPTRITTPGPEMRECGGILTGTSGYISYHLTDYYASFERCVWTLQVPFATSYYFAVTDYLIADEADGLVISTLYGPRSYSGDYVNDKNISNFHVSARTSGILLSGNVAILTFHSDNSDNSRGFRIYYEATTSGQAYPRTGVIAQTASQLDFPFSGSSYGNLELGTFVFTPNFKVDSTGVFSNFAKYTRRSLEEQCICCDRLNVFRFDNLMEWEPHPTNFLLCDNITQAEFVHDDMLLFAFRSDSSNAGKGFTLSFYTGPTL